LESSSDKISNAKLEAVTLMVDFYFSQGFCKWLPNDCGDYAYDNHRQKQIMPTKPSLDQIDLLNEPEVVYQSKTTKKQILD
jgi:hypothetical protein